MKYAKKMALVDSRMLEFVLSQPLSANPIGNIMRRLDDEIRLKEDEEDKETRAEPGVEN